MERHKWKAHLQTDQMLKWWRHGRLFSPGMPVNFLVEHWVVQIGIAWRPWQQQVGASSHHRKHGWEGLFSHETATVMTWLPCKLGVWTLLWRSMERSIDFLFWTAKTNWQVACRPLLWANSRLQYVRGWYRLHGCSARRFEVFAQNHSN